MEILGKGVYTIPDVHRITGLSSKNIRRWLKGYSYRYNGKIKQSQKLWTPEFGEIDNVMCLSFNDLIELKVVGAFKCAGISLSSIRQALDYAQKEMDMKHPFSNRQFYTDGKKIFVEAKDEHGYRVLEEIRKQQIVFNEIVNPFLKQLEFEDDILVRWWPLSREKQVVLDPTRNFGQPIVNKEGILTDILASAHIANQSYEIVADWYGTSIESVKDAVEYEQKLVA